MRHVFGRSALMVTFALIAGCAGFEPHHEFVLRPGFEYEQPAWSEVREATAEVLVGRLRDAGFSEVEVIADDDGIVVAHACDGAKRGDLKFLITELGGISFHLVLPNRKATGARRVTTRDGETIYVSVREGEHLPWGHVAVAQKALDAMGSPAISLEFDEEGTRRIGELTAAHLGRSLAIIVGDRVVMTAAIRDRIGGSAQVTGDFSIAEIDRWVKLLSYPPLPCRLEVVEERSVGGA